VGIVAHHARAEQAHKLMEDVGATYLSMDNGSLGCDANHKKVWSWLSGKDTTWSVVLEDDAIPVEGFTKQLEQVLSVAPTPIVSLYLGQGRPQHWQPRIDLAKNNANSVDASWLIAPALLHAVGVAVRTELLPKVLFDKTKPIDDAWTEWIRTQHLRVGYTWPSLLEHRDEDTLVKHPDGVPRTQHRKAWWCHTRQDWTDRAVKL
jgi:hypothetical protein